MPVDWFPNFGTIDIEGYTFFLRHQVETFVLDPTGDEFVTFWFGGETIAESWARDFSSTSSPGDLIGPENLHDRVGAYHTVAVESSGTMRYRRSDIATPPFSLSVALIFGASPSLCLATWGGADYLSLAYFNATGIDRILSSDDGKTWGTPVSLAATGQHPRSAATDIGTVIHAWWDASGVIMAVEEYAPAQFTASWTFVDSTATALVIDDASFSISQAKEGAARWLLVAISGGAVVHWVSSDDCRTWTVTP